MLDLAAFGALLPPDQAPLGSPHFVPSFAKDDSMSHHWSTRIFGPV